MQIPYLERKTISTKDQEITLLPHVDPMVNYFKGACLDATLIDWKGRSFKPGARRQKAGARLVACQYVHTIYGMSVVSRGQTVSCRLGLDVWLHWVYL